MKEECLICNALLEYLEKMNLWSVRSAIKKRTAKPDA